MYVCMVFARILVTFICLIFICQLGKPDRHQETLKLHLAVSCIYKKNNMLLTVLFPIFKILYSLSMDFVLVYKTQHQTIQLKKCFLAGAKRVILNVVNMPGPSCLLGQLASQTTVFALYCLLAETAIIKSHLLVSLYNFGVHSQDF